MIQLPTIFAVATISALFLSACAAPTHQAELAERKETTKSEAGGQRKTDPKTDPKTQHKIEAKKSDTRTWTHAHELCVEGQAFKDLESPFDRLPAVAKSTLRAPVWQLGRHSAGICVRFRSDAQQLDLRWRLGSEKLALPHMPATGVSGADLYVQELGRLRWLATAFPLRKDNECRLFSGLDGTMREFVLYLPLYNVVESLAIGTPQGKRIEAWPRESTSRPIVFYGTSITQGACASRPGSCHVAMLGRRLDRPVVNLGFSGNGKLELAVVPLLASIDAAVYVLDCLPNLHEQLVRERLVPFVLALRKARPATPILLVEDRRYADAYLSSARRKRNEGNWRAHRKGFRELQAAGVRALHYVEGPSLLGSDSEDTVDGSHPSDLGFFRMSETLERALLPLLD